MAIRLSGMISGLDTDAIIKELMSAQSLKKTKIEQNKEKLEWKKEKWEEMNTKIYSLYTEKLSELKLQGTFLTKKVSSSDESKVKSTATTAVNGSYSLKIESLAAAQYVTGADISSKELKGDSTLISAGMQSGSVITVKTGKSLENTTSITVETDTTVSDLVEKLKGAGLNASFDAANGRFYISAKDSGIDNKFTIESNADAGTGLEVLGLGNISESMALTGQTADDASKMAVVAAADARVQLNGALIASAGNTITANGLTLELTGVTTGAEVINLTVNNDTEAVYTKIKDFFKEYNDLLKEMNEKYNAASARDYAMLTDDDKEAMTEEQIELWENKIKDSLLRRDDTLNSLISTMRTAMQKTVEIDGKTYSLATFGIGTGAYTEKGLIHINGNEDDGEYASKEDQLKKALNEDPETVGKVFSDIMSGLYKDLTDKMSATSISSALTFYNDKQIQSQIDDYETQIDDWEDRLLDLEDRYYKQFSVMESAMAELQSQQTSLGNLMGM